MPGISMESALLQLDLELRVGMPWIESDEKDAEFLQPIKKPRKETGESLKEKKMMKHMENLVQEFFREPSEKRSILGGGGMDALERWFSELGVRWVLLLDVADYASAWIKNEMVSLLSEKQGKAFEAIWSTLEEIRTGVIKPMDTQTPQRSSDILKATYSVMDDINFLLCNHSTVNPLVSEAASLGKYVPLTGLGEAPPFISLIAEMVSCLEEKLITMSQLFLDQGLSFLFLLNNLNFIWEQLEYYYIKVDVAAITRKVDHYIESYIQVLSCLFNPTPLYLVTKYSPLSKFESEFQKTYTTQKLWKVPDPELRKWLRKSVIEKIIPGYTKYIEDSKVTNPKFTPQELEEMLQELFEG
ncbi:exocyst complex component EXO70E2-like [Miscanthus floridulus]|uniref:exocyst complex component EXO70E2-like n=1 Tax=Miscanthus floridulus TaxID=154761 RepID=UPI003457523A